MKKFSKKWMQTFIEGELPKDDNFILQEVSKKGFEVEGFEKLPDGDTLFEVKVLPNRISDALSIRGMGREFAAIFGLGWGGKIEVPDLQKFKTQIFSNLDINATPQDPLYMFAGIKVINFDNTKETPEWIKDIILKSGGRSINCLVDITNLMLYAFGQPAHVFDFDKITGKVSTRFAHEGEELELLDGKKIKLSGTDFVIADEAKALSLAGIKGGKFAETTKQTKNAFFEMANFNATMIRKTSTRLNIRTDASKIFENGITTLKTEEVFGILLATILDIDKSAKIEFIISQKFKDKSPQWVETTFDLINNFAGQHLTKEEILKLLQAQSFATEVSGEILKVKASAERLDINIGEDVAEEVLRLYGFDNIKSKALNLPATQQHSPMFLLENFLVCKLLEKGYTEIFNYTFVSKGEVKLKSGLAEDKMFLREDLSTGMKVAFQKNYNYLPVLMKNEVKAFEIGSVFTKNGEGRNCVLLFEDNKKKSKFLPKILEDLTDILSELGLDKEKIVKIYDSEKPAMFEFSLSALLEELKIKKLFIPFLAITKNLQNIQYKKISIYPFIVRDVAVWVPENLDFTNDIAFPLINSVLKGVTFIYAGTPYVFDEFLKEDKKSIAFRIIFQSYEKTLTDEEVEVEMQKVYKYLKDKNFEIR